MPKRARDDSTELNFPIPAKRLEGKKHKWYYAAWFIAETYRLNPKKDITKRKAAVEEGWRDFGLSTWPECRDDMMAGLQTPRVRRLWADLWLQYSTYTQAASCRLPPLQQTVNFAFGSVEKVAVLFGHPGFVIWVPFYGDLLMLDVKYSYIADGIRTLNPELSITPHIVESIFLHIVWNEYWGKPEDDIGFFVKRELYRGRNAQQKSGPEPLFITDDEDVLLEKVMIIPEVANSYEEFNTACHYLNPRSYITREQIYESYRWRLTITLGLTGYPLLEALRGSLPACIEACHDAVKEVGATLRKQILDVAAPPSTEPDKRFFSMTYACHRMLSAAGTRGILPIIRLPYTESPADKKLKKTVMAYFSQQYRRLNPLKKLTKVDIGEAWGIMVGAVPAPTAVPEATPDDAVAVKAED